MIFITARFLCIMVLHVIEARGEEFCGAKSIQMLDWPGSSPDLNPIENLRSLMKNKVSEKHPTSLDGLRSAIKEVWVKQISSDYCCKLIESIPRCLQEVLKNKGRHTKC